jgi:hypothetical protein
MNKQFNDMDTKRNASKNKKQNKAELSYLHIDDGDVLQSVWLRYDFFQYPQPDRFILDYSFNFLPHIWVFILFIFLLV